MIPPCPVCRVSKIYQDLRLSTILFAFTVNFTNLLQLLDTLADLQVNETSLGPIDVLFLQQSWFQYGATRADDQIDLALAVFTSPMRVLTNASDIG
jgi:hypothetical protein